MTHMTLLWRQFSTNSQLILKRLMDMRINNNLTCWSWENNNLKAASLSLRSSVLTTAIQDGLNIARLFNPQIIKTN